MGLAAALVLSQQGLPPCHYNAGAGLVGPTCRVAACPAVAAPQMSALHCVNFYKLAQGCCNRPGASVRSSPQQLALQSCEAGDIVLYMCCGWCCSSASPARAASSSGFCSFSLLVATITARLLNSLNHASTCRGASPVLRRISFLHRLRDLGPECILLFLPAVV